MKNQKKTNKHKNQRKKMTEEFYEGKETLCGNCGRIATWKYGDIHRCNKCMGL